MALRTFARIAWRVLVMAGSAVVLAWAACSGPQSTGWPLLASVGSAIAAVAALLWASGYSHRHLVHIYRTNSNWQHMRDLTWRMINDAQSQVTVVSSMDPAFWADDVSLNVVRKALDRGVKFRFLSGETLDDGLRPLIDLLNRYAPGTSVQWYTIPNTPEQHFIVVDGENVRLEQRHGVLTDRRREPRAQVSWLRPSFGYQLDEVFNTIVADAQRGPLGA